MKAALLLVTGLLSLTAVSAQASVSNYSVSEAYVVPSQPGVKPSDQALCPRVKSIAVENGPGDIGATKLTLHVSERSVSLETTGSSKTCHSDIVCPTEDNFSIDAQTLVSIERNNDGNYPTTDVAGHNSLTILGFMAPGRTLACYYRLN